MNIPKQLKIGSQIIIVTQKPLDSIDSECNGGWARWEQNELILASNLPQDRKEQVFIHEILHFINIYLEEETVTYLSECIYQVFRDNKIF
jgi:hypothetical protein